MGVEVLSPEQLENFPNANIIIASADFFGEIRNLLTDKGYRKLYDMSELLQLDLPKEEMSNRALEMYANRQHYIDVVQNQACDKVVLNRVQYVVTERCSLRCKDCSHLIPYYKCPQDIDLDFYKTAFERLLDSVDYIAELRILGGEPFLHKDMGKLIDWYHDHEKIESISIYTNGTILPSEILLPKLKREKVKIHISNYGINEARVSSVAKILEENQIVHFVRKYDVWQETGGLAYRNYSEKEKESVFAGCFERNGYTFLKGRLYRCPRVAHAVNLKAIPDTGSDYIDFMDAAMGRVVIREKIRKLQELASLEGCNYCGGPDNHVQGIAPAIQISNPIEYEEWKKDEL